MTSGPPFKDPLLSREWGSLSGKVRFRNYRETLERVYPLIFYPRHHHYVMRLKISRINIYLHIQRREGGERTKAHEAILKGRRTLIYFLALPHHHRPRMEWDQERACVCTRWIYCGT